MQIKVVHRGREWCGCPETGHWRRWKLRRKDGLAVSPKASLCGPIMSARRPCHAEQIYDDP